MSWTRSGASGPSPSRWASSRRRADRGPGGPSLDRPSERSTGLSILAITVTPGVSGRAQLSELAEPRRPNGELLVEMLALGVCGTDREILAGLYGWAPAGRDRVPRGHESLGRVREAAAGSGVERGDLVVGIVRRPDPQPCRCCA